jgi:hypothetical protein
MTAQRESDANVARRGAPLRDDARMRRASRRTAVVLGLIAFGIYAFFILRHVLRAQGQAG